MRLCRFNDDRLGLVNGDYVFDVTSALDRLPVWRYPAPPFDTLIANLDELKSVITTLAGQAEPLHCLGVKLLSPVASPRKIIAAPVNYRKHLDEARLDPEIHHQNAIGEIRRVGLFLKATSSLVGAGDGIAIRHPERRNDHEIELAVVIGARADRVEPADALRYVAGYCIGLDMTIRGPEERSLRKSIDSFTVLGPWLVSADEIGEPDALTLTLKVNAETRQSANTRDLIMTVRELIAYASSFYTLYPGDIILTGTPEGVGSVHAGDLITAAIEPIGSMSVRVRLADAPNAVGSAA